LAHQSYKWAKLRQWENALDSSSHSRRLVPWLVLLSVVQ
jgi:hypothetical protein